MALRWRWPTARSPHSTATAGWLHERAEPSLMTLVSCRIASLTRESRLALVLYSRPNNCTSTNLYRDGKEIKNSDIVGNPSDIAQGKRKTAAKPAGPKKRDGLDTKFKCVFCNSEDSISTKIDKKAGVASLSCKNCDSRFGWRTCKLLGAYSIAL